jgi:hypothetical protein
MSNVKKSCLSCKHFRVEDIHSGLCRIQKTLTVYPVKHHDNLCDLWCNCGQRYYIRSGWIKSKRAAAQDNTKKGP